MERGSVSACLEAKRSSTAFAARVGIFLCAVASLPGAAGQSAVAHRPNFIVILIDDLRWDELGCAGHPYVKTPSIDRIAREGLLCRNAFVVAPLCSPSRASLLTGRYPHSHGIIDNTNRSAQSYELKTFPRVLHDAGYETAFIGKWHMGNDPKPRPGFDYWVGMPGQGESVDPDLFEDGHLAKVHGYVTDIFTERAVSFLRRPRARPFLLYLPHKAIHPNVTQRDDGSLSDPTAETFIPARRHERLYADAKIPRRPNADDTLDGKPALTRRLEGVPPLGPGTGSSDEAILGRQRMLAAVDEGVGQIFQALEQTGQLDDTVFVFTSDEGYFYGEHHLSVERRLAYEESIRIPLLIRYPRLIRAGSTLDEIVLNIDLAPTVLELAGTPATEAVHGRSIVPLLRGEAGQWRSSFLVEYYSDTVFARMRNMGYTAVRRQRYKYIRYAELQGMDELYDLEADPYELKNIFAEPASRPALIQMQAELDKLKEQAK
jgi:N-acetylglucosamine-6-sulfatase